MKQTIKTQSPSKVRGVPLVGSLLLLTLTGCSATSLRCGVDGDSSFVELYNFPQSITRETQRMADLCGFAYEPQTEPDVKLNLIDPE